MPLLAGSSTAYCRTSSKSPYDSGVTRNPAPLSAWAAPSTIDQLASPIWFQPSRDEPSSSVVQPASWADAGAESPRAAVKRARAKTVVRFIEWSPVAF